MSNSLDNSIRDALNEHDGVLPEDAPTLVCSPPTSGGRIGSLPGHSVEGFIARGGMGAVYRARQLALEREVAVKVMTSKAESPEMAARFRREALVLGKLAHPNIVPVYDIGTDEEGQVFYTMKLVKGQTLQAILNELASGDSQGVKEHSMASLLTVFRKVCDALAFAHSQGILHRDLKPENVMVGEFGEVLVMDWGLAKVLRSNDEIRMTNAEVSEAAPSSTFGILNSSFTLQGCVMGTPQYMSPEQALGQVEELDERSDIFSLGGILYAILTLRPPVEGRTLEEVLQKVRTAQITSPSDIQAGTAAKGKAKVKSDVLEAKLIKPLPHAPGGRVPAALSSVVMKALRLDKSQRYPSVTALSADIEAYQGGFATSAEQAGTLKQLKLLMLRHKAVTATLAAMVLLSIGFVWQVMASERKATRNAEIAKANEQRANENAEQTRRALMTSQMAVAEAALRSADLPTMVQALDSVPKDLRDQRWSYLSAKRDTSLGPLNVAGFTNITGVRAISGMPGKFALVTSQGDLGVIDVRSRALTGRMRTKYRGALVCDVTANATKFAVSAEGADTVEIHTIPASGDPKVFSNPADKRHLKRLVFSPDGNQMLCLDPMGVTLVNLEDGAVRWRQLGSPADALFSPDGKRVFIGDHANRAFAVNSAETGELISSIKGYVRSMAMSLDGSRLAVGHLDGEVMIFDVATGKEVRRVRLLLGGVRRMAWTKGGHLLTIGSSGGIERGRLVMQLWETKNFSPAGTFFGLRSDYADLRLDFDPLTGYALVGDNPLRVWRVPAGLEAATVTSVQAEQGWSVCFLNDRELLGRTDYNLVRFDLSDPQMLKPKPPLGPSGWVMAVPHWGTETLAMASRLGDAPFGIKIFSTADGKLTDKLSIPVPRWVMRMDFDSSGQRLVASFDRSAAVVLDVATGKTLLTLPVTVERAVFAGSSHFIAATVPIKRLANDVEYELVLLDSHTGAVVKKQTYRHHLTELAVSPDRKLLAIGGTEQVIRLLDAETLEERSHFRAHDGEITSLTFHPSLPVLASGSGDGSVKLWDYTTAKMQSNFIGLDDMPIMIAFSPSARFMAVETQGRAWRLFDLKQDQESVPSAKIYEHKPLPPVAPGPDGWQDLIAALTDDYLADESNGWVRSKGSLLSPNQGPATLPLPGVATGMSYHLHLRLRELEPKEVFHVVLPVGSRMVGFDLDGAPFLGHYTGLVQVDKKWGKTLPGALYGKQIQDSAPHDLDFEVRLRGQEVSITVTLDKRPFYEWSGPQEALEPFPFWRCLPGRLSVGGMAANWEVQEVKLRPLE